MLRTEYQLRFSCGTHSRGNCTVILQRQSRNFKSLNVIMSTKLELLISDIIVRSYSKCSNCYPFTRTHARRRFLVALFSPLSPFSWLQNTWPWMTLNGLKSHFTSYVHYYELPRTNYFYLFTVVCLLHLWPRHVSDVTTGEVREAE